MTAHNIGDKVVANTNAQGLVAGAKYLVVDVDVQSVGIFGDVVTYLVRPWSDALGTKLAIGNGHLLLQPAT